MDSEPGSPPEWTALASMLEPLRVAGQPLHVQGASQPFMYLGALFCMNLDSTPHFEYVKKLILTRGAAIAKSDATLRQKLEMERTNELFGVEYYFVHAPFSVKQVQDLNAFRARHLKACLKLPATSASEVL